MSQTQNKVEGSNVSISKLLAADNIAKNDDQERADSFFVVW
jgi:hypothetical protein